MDLPKFRLSPNAYALDLFAAESGTCSCCGQARELKYNSSFYSREEPDYLCPWCMPTAVRPRTMRANSTTTWALKA
ncbi:hypothetical protein Cthiooxydans_39820 [Comamonas thiooxydans]|nr:hypothetical protein Cthiooxydans_39820 [Comamonas thiooxydans]